MLNLRTGYTVADASNLFDKSFKREDLVEWRLQHARPSLFVKALDGGDARAALPIAGYKKLYEIEAEIRDKDEDAKRAARQARSKEVFDDIVAWCRAYQPERATILGAGQSDPVRPEPRERWRAFWSTERFRSTTGSWSGCTCARR